MILMNSIRSAFQDADHIRPLFFHIRRGSIQLMSVAWPINTFTCLRCLARRSLRAPPISLQRSRRTFASQSEAVNAPDQDGRKVGAQEPREQRRPARSPKTKGWTSFIKSTYLGRHASILVLRDAERKRGVREEYDNVKVQETPLKDVNVDELLASINEQEKAPGQAEVNASIEELRPIPSLQASGGSITLPLNGFEGLLRKLMRSYNQLQISRYITIQEGARLVRAQDREVQQKNTPRLNRVIARSEWYGLDSKGRPIPRARQGATRKGKKGLVEYLLRHVWEVQVAEEYSRVGCVELKLQSAQLRSLLSGGERSALSLLGRRYEVKLDASRKDSTVKITADRTNANEAAKSLENMLAGLCEIQVDLGPLMSSGNARHTGGMTVELAHTICERLGCGCRRTNQSKEITIQALSLDQAHHCRRTLLSHACIDEDAEILLVESDGKNGSATAWTAFGNEFLDVVSEQAKATGRTFLPAKIASRAISTRLRTTQLPISSETFTKAFDFLEGKLTDSEHQPVKTISRGPSSRKAISFAATFGHISLVHKSPSIQPRKLSNLRQKANAQRFFNPTNIGLPHFLLQHLNDQQPQELSSIEVHLVPSPWDPVSADRRHELPHLTLVFTIAQAARRVTFNHMVSTQPKRKAAIMLPTLGADVELVGTNRIVHSAMVMEPALRSFIRDVENSGSGYSRITAPPSLAILRTTLESSFSIPAADREAHDDGVKTYHYFTSGIELAQDLTFDLDGFQLVYSRLGGGERGHKTSSVTLRTSEENDGIQDRRTNFSEKINEILVALNSGTGNMSMMSMRPRPAGAGVEDGGDMTLIAQAAG